MRFERLLSLVGLVIGLLSFATVFWTLPGAPQEREIASFLRSRLVPGEVVVVTPAMSLDRLRSYTTAGLPAVTSPVDLILETSAAARFWVVGPLGTGMSPAASFGAEVEQRHLVANTAVWQLRSTGAYAAKRDALARLLEGATVRVRSRSDAAGEGRPCRHEGTRFRCGASAWQWVGPETMTVQGEPRLCLWAHPMAQKTLSLELPSLRAGARVRLTTLQSDAAVSRRRGAPIEVVVLARAQSARPVEPSRAAPSATELDEAPLSAAGSTSLRRPDRVLAQAEHPAGLAHLETEFSLVDTGRGVVVEISVDDDGLAHFCLDVEVLP